MRLGLITGRGLEELMSTGAWRRRVLTGGAKKLHVIFHHRITAHSQHYKNTEYAKLPKYLVIAQADFIVRFHFCIYSVLVKCKYLYLGHFMDDIIIYNILYHDMACYNPHIHGS